MRLPPRCWRHWVRRDSCSPEARRTALPERRSGAPDATRFDWPGCEDGTEVALLKILGGGHWIPSASPRDPPFTIKGAAEIWSFLSAHRRGG